MVMNHEVYIKSFIAGCDMQVVSLGGIPLKLIMDLIQKTVDVGTLSTQRVSEALKRIRRAKKGIRLHKGKFSKKTFDRLCREFEDFNKECRSAESEDA